MLLPNLPSILLTALLLIPSAHAQFRFFNDFFEGQGQHQQQERQNDGSDSNWYQQSVEKGTHYMLSDPCPL